MTAAKMKGTNLINARGALVIPLPAELAPRVLAFSRSPEAAVFRGQPENASR
jgi:hypothetical protein